RRRGMVRAQGVDLSGQKRGPEDFHVPGFAQRRSALGTSPALDGIVVMKEKVVGAGLRRDVGSQAAGGGDFGQALDTTDMNDMEGSPSFSRQLAGHADGLDFGFFRAAGEKIPHRGAGNGPGGLGQNLRVFGMNGYGQAMGLGAKESGPQGG